jgi:hypothetical protein
MRAYWKARFFLSITYKVRYSSPSSPFPPRLVMATGGKPPFVATFILRNPLLFRCFVPLVRGPR